MNDVDKKEAWKDVVGYEGLYKVSNFGNVYSCYVNRNLKQGTHRDSPWPFPAQCILPAPWGAKKTPPQNPAGCNRAS